MKRSIMIFSGRVLMISMLSLSLCTPNAQAVMISSDQVISSQAAQVQRERVRALFDRQDVRQQLQARGVDADAARARVDALTDDEVAAINGKLDNLPAGGDMGPAVGDLVGALVFIFLVLLITDILGFTKVFPFTKPIRR